MSMFTGLKAVNHFGRPDMSSFLKFVQKKHSYVRIVLNCNVTTTTVRHYFLDYFPFRLAKSVSFLVGRGP